MKHTTVSSQLVTKAELARLYNLMIGALVRLSALPIGAEKDAAWVSYRKCCAAYNSAKAEREAAR